MSCLDTNSQHFLRRVTYRKKVFVKLYGTLYTYANKMTPDCHFIDFYFSSIKSMLR